jgi:hypothetical protein
VFLAQSQQVGFGFVFHASICEPGGLQC